MKDRNERISNIHLMIDEYIEKHGLAFMESFINVLDYEKSKASVERCGDKLCDDEECCLKKATVNFITFNGNHQCCEDKKFKDDNGTIQKYAR